MHIVCPHCRELINPKADTREQREHTSPCTSCNGPHPACQH